MEYDSINKKIGNTQNKKSFVLNYKIRNIKKYLLFLNNK